MKKKVLSFLMAGLLILGSGFQAAAASVTDVKQQQTQTKNKLNEINQEELLDLYNVVKDYISFLEADIETSEVEKKKK